MMKLPTDLLVALIERHDPAAMRQLARLIIEENVEQPGQIYNAKILLILAARSSDRKAGWLLCKYYLEGIQDFQKDIEKARYWRNRTEQRLYSDTQLIYLDSSVAAEAATLYRIWRHWLNRHWPEEPDSGRITESEAEP